MTVIKFVVTVDKEANEFKNIYTILDSDSINIQVVAKIITGRRHERQENKKKMKATQQLCQPEKKQKNYIPICIITYIFISTSI